jgi:hypothetical protein
MSATGARLAPELERSTQERNPLAYLIHALNQPLTGLQCSLELAVAGPRRAEQYVRTLRDGLQLTARMRILVEAMRELIETGGPKSQEAHPFELNLLLRDAVDDLLPVARERQIQISLMGGEAIEVGTSRQLLAALTFRLLDSALSLAEAGTELRLAARSEGEYACITASWVPGALPEGSPFSRPELGMLVARAGWEQAAAEWTSTATDGRQSCTIRLPMRGVANVRTEPSHLPAPYAGDLA